MGATRSSLAAPVRPNHGPVLRNPISVAKSRSTRRNAKDACGKFESLLWVLIVAAALELSKLTWAEFATAKGFRDSKRISKHCAVRQDLVNMTNTVGPQLSLGFSMWSTTSILRGALPASHLQPELLLNGGEDIGEIVAVAMRAISEFRSLPSSDKEVTIAHEEKTRFDFGILLRRSGSRSAVNIGAKMPDGTIYDGISPDTKKPMYSGMHRQTQRQVRIRLPEFGTPFNCLSRDSELSHSGNQRGPVHPELGGGSTRPADKPTGLSKHRDDMGPFGVNQRPDWRGPDVPRYQFRRTLIQHRARRHDHGALDYVLQLPDITRPVIASQILHHFFGNALDRLSPYGPKNGSA